MSTKGKHKLKTEAMLIIFFVVSGMALGFSISQLIQIASAEKPVLKFDSGCENLDLFNTSLCLAYDLREWYVYNSSNMKANLSLDELKTEGGVCWQFAEYYGNRLRELGFNTKQVIIDVENNTYHQFVIASDKRGYCLLDQEAVKCFALKQ